MKVTADKEYLKKLSDAADYAMIAYEEAFKEGEELPQMKKHFMTISYYFSYLGVKAVEDEELANELQETLDDLRGRAQAMKSHIIVLAQFLRTCRRVKYPSDDMPTEEDLEDDFETLEESVDLDKAEEFKEQLLEYQRNQEDEESEDSKEELINRMFG